MSESSTMGFGREFEILNGNGFQGSVDEQRIFNEVFFDSGMSTRKSFLFTETMRVDDVIMHGDTSLCSNSGRSSLTSQNDYTKEDFSGKHSLEYPCVDLESPYKGSYKIKSSTEDMPDIRDVLNSAATAGDNLDMSPEKSGSSCAVEFCVVESYGKCITSSRYQPSMYKGCDIVNRGKLKNKVLGVEQEVLIGGVCSPISQESYASKLLVDVPPVSITNNLQTQRQANHKWKDSCFIKLDEEEFSRPKDIKNDPRPLLRYHINRLLRAAGWLIGRRKRNNKYKGIGEYVYKSPLGRPIREFYRAWRMCGENLMADVISFTQMSENMQWADLTEFWADLFHTFGIIEENLNVLVSASAMAQLWCILDPYANVVFIEKTIRLLKQGVEVKAKRTLLTASDTVSVAKYQKIPESERSNIVSGFLQDSKDKENYPRGLHESDIPVDLGEKQIHGSHECFFTNQVSHACSLSSKQAESVGGIKFGPLTNPNKKSRKLSEMKQSGNHFVGRGCFHVSEMNSSNSLPKKSKFCDFHDDDLLICALKKTKRGKTPKKRSKQKPKPLRKQKTPKGSCRLLPRTLKRGGEYIMEAKWSIVESRTVLSWLIHCSVISINDVVQYRNREDDVVLKDGVVTRDGILCNCCHKVLSVSEFKFHADFRSDNLCMNLFLEPGKPLILCQLEAWSTEYQARQVAPRMNQDNEIDQNDDSCGRCGDVGELICCDNCPSAFHQGCLFEQELPEGNWYCHRCRCQICGDVVIDKETSQQLDDLKCSQCDHKYHRKCMQDKHSKIVLSSETWFCCDSCHEVHMGLQSRIGLKNYIADGFSWTLLRCISDDDNIQTSQYMDALKAECNSKLAVAITIMEECFLPMVDTRTGISMIPQVIFNWGSEFARLDYRGFYTVILEEDDVIVCVASIRIHGTEVAELPLIATCSRNRRRGMCRRLINSIEKMLVSLKIRQLVVSAIPDLVETWSVGFGFEAVEEEEERRSLSEINLMVFPCSIWLKKKLV